MRLAERIVAIALVIMAAVAVPGAARAESPRRGGVTVELGFGAASTVVGPTDVETHLGRSVLAIGLGYFVTDRLALMARHTGAVFSRTIGGSDEPFQNAFAGVVAQYWLSDQLMMSGGPGLLWIDTLPFESDIDYQADLGLGVALRSAYSFVTVKQKHSFRVALEVFPGIYDGILTFGSTLTLEWQFL
jgi:hypothetical protein